LQAQLQQAMKMEAVGRLAGGVAHDFNNLLTVITGYSELLLQKIGKESPMHGEVEEIKRAGERAASLTQQLLAFSRKQIIEPKVIYLDHLVAEMNKMLTRLIGEDIALHATTGKSLGSVKVDPGQFQQILMNLVVNARDAMPDGGTIVIETANVDLDEGYCALHPYVTPGRFVMLSVSDTGKGMSEVVKAHIFEPFFTTKEMGKGTGLGLATTYGVVKQAGGSIEVYSEVGKGTSFRIYLPRVEGEAVKPRESDLTMELPAGSGTVLLVEDEVMVRSLGIRILERSGYRVMQAGNGDEAIAMAMGYGERIDLLLTDVVMPGMGGIELANRLTRIHPETRVLFTSGYTENAIVHQGVLDEGVSFIAKPYSPSALAKKIREVLNKA
jgi:two-component system, cell cycle sensor histidine kinase and response regulator CckA